MSLGFTEIILIVLFILIVFGAKRIPELARAMGRASYEFKKAKNALSTEGQELMNAAEKAAAKEEKQEKEQADDPCMAHADCDGCLRLYEKV